ARPARPICRRAASPGGDIMSADSPDSTGASTTGIGTLIGGIIGSSLLVFLKEVLSSHVGHWYLILGAIFVAVALLLPKGIVGTALAIRERRQADLDAAARPADAADEEERP
ncbi:MAG: hypothetical protein KDJ29_08075, partial [Hyphomicrobiales bacterium]|nr:hypothetical protein [Hyphomicrobiales bacterium]